MKMFFFARKQEDGPYISTHTPILVLSLDITTPEDVTNMWS